MGKYVLSLIAGALIALVILGGLHENAINKLTPREGGEYLWVEDQLDVRLFRLDGLEEAYGIALIPDGSVEIAGDGVIEIIFEEEDCMLWALGEGYEALPVHELDDVWNSRHGDLFMLSGLEAKEVALDLMREAYRVVHG